MILWKRYDTSPSGAPRGRLENEEHTGPESQLYFSSGLLGGRDQRKYSGIRKRQITAVELHHGSAQQFSAQRIAIRLQRKVNDSGFGQRVVPEEMVIGYRLLAGASRDKPSSTRMG